MSRTESGSFSKRPMEPGFFTRTSFIQLGFGIWTSLTEATIGMAFGFSAVAIPQLQKNDSIVPVTTAESAWIASVLNLFSPIGCIVGGYILDHYGRRFMLILCEIPMAMGWLYTGLAQSPIHMIIGRILTGVGIGMGMAPTRVFNAEISLPIMRGVLGGLINVSLSMGLTVMALLGSYLEWKTLCYICATYSSMLCIANFFLPETPYFVLLKKTPAKTRDTLKKYRSKSYDIEHEMINLIQFKHENEIRKLTTKQKIKALFTKAACIPLWIMLPFLVMSQTSGITIIMFYTVEILQHSKLSIDANAGNVLMGLTRVVCGIIAAFLIFKFKRRPLILFSSFSLSLICGILGVYLIFSEADTAFPMICYVLYIACASVGWYSLMLVIMCELYPLQIRGILGGISISVLNIAVFTANSIFPYLKKAIGLPYTILCFALSSIIATILLYFRLPETKGLTLEEIEGFFKRKSMSHSSQTVQRSGENSAKSMSAEELQDFDKKVQKSRDNTVLDPVKNTR